MASFFTRKDGTWAAVDSDIDKSGTGYYPEVIRVIDCDGTFIAHGCKRSMYQWLSSSDNLKNALNAAIIEFNSIQPWNNKTPSTGGNYFCPKN